MIEFLVLSCLLAVATSVSNTNPNLPAPAVPFYPQPYYPQANAVKPKYINAPPPGVASAAAYVASPYYPGTYYRQAVFAPANPAYNPYYQGGYGVFPAYPQQYPYLANDGASQGYGNSFTEFMNYYFGSYGSYFPSYGSSSESQESQSSSQQSGAGAGAGLGAGESEETSSLGLGGSESAGVNEGIDLSESPAPAKVDKPTEGQKKEDQPAAAEPMPVPLRPFGTTPQLFYFGQPQFYGQAPFQQAAFYDPSRINSVNNGAISNFLFNRNQPQQPYQQPQQFAGQQFYQVPQPQPAPGSAALAYQRFLQNQKYQQAQPQRFQQQQQQPFLHQQQPFLQQQQQQPFQQQQPEQQSQDDSSVVVDSASRTENGVQQQAQPKLATDPTKAVAEPLGIAFAGTGGRAGAGPVGTAIVGNNATAIADPKATAISLDQKPTFSLTPVHRMTSAYVAKYSPELGVYKISKIKRNLT